MTLRRIRALRRTRFSGAHKGFAAMSASSVVAQLLTILATPVLTRLYSPEAFGTFAVVLSTVMIASTVGPLRLELAIPTAAPGEARRLVHIALVSSALVALVTLPFALRGLKSSGETAVTLSVLTVPLLVWLYSATTVLVQYLLRAKEYAKVARRAIIQSAATAAGQIGMSTWTRAGVGLLTGAAIGQVVGVVALLASSDLLSKSRLEAESIWRVLRHNWRFPLVFLPSALLNVIGSQLPLLLLNWKYGAASAGNLAQALRFGALPAALLGTALSSVFMAETAARVREGQIHNRSRFLRVTRALLPMAISWFMGLVLIAPELLPVILGAGWDQSGQYAAATAIMVATGLVASPLSVVFAIYRKSLMNLALDAARVILVLALGYGAWALGSGPVGAVWAMSAGLAVIYLGTWLLGLRVVSQRPVDPEATWVHP